MWLPTSTTWRRPSRFTPESRRCGSRADPGSRSLALPRQAARGRRSPNAKTVGLSLGYDEEEGASFDAGRRVSRGTAVHADPQVAVLLRLPAPRRADVQLLQPHVSPAPLRRPGRGVLAAPERGHALGCRRRAAGGDHWAG